MLKMRNLLATVVALALLAFGAVTVGAQDGVTPSVTVGEQAITITVDSVTSDGPGWIAVHADDNGSPGPVIGVASVPDGESTDVEVELDPTGITEQLHVMLHIDAGTEGTWEFPGPDEPAQADGETVVEPMMLTMPEMLTEAGAEGEEAEMTPTPEAGEEEEEMTPTAEAEEEDEDMTPTAEAEEEDEDMTPTAEAGAEDEEEDMTPTAEGEAEDEEMLPETGGPASLLPVLGLAAAGAMLLGIGFVFAYRKQD